MVIATHAEVVLVCWASEPHMIAGALSQLSVTDDGMYWHDHSDHEMGGDIVCTGPFTLARLEFSKSPREDSES